jgi:Acyl-CoA oxidase
MASGEIDMFDVYLNEVPFSLSILAMAFGEVFYLEAYLRRLSHLKCEKTKKVFLELGILYAISNIIETRVGDFRE